MEFAAACYILAREFPRDELFGLTSQLKRAAASTAANIAEGYGRDNLSDYIRSLQIAQGSLKEAETHILLAIRVGLVVQAKTEPAMIEADRVGRMLRALIRSLQTKKAAR